MRSYGRKYGPELLVVCTTIIAEVFLFYAVPRSDFIGTYSLFLILFAGWFYIVKNSRLSFSFCIALAILLRLIAMFSLPVLSDDYFRFIWDGKQILGHVNPFQYTPLDYLKIHPGNAYWQYLYENMNSQEYHSIYPAVLQYIFAGSVWLFPNNPYGAAVIMKLFIFLAECGSMRIFYLLLKRKNIPVRNALWYVLNPLIIIELTGNVHFEGVMLFFFLAGYYLLEKKSYWLSGICWGLAIATKMIPLMLAPLILRAIGWKAFLRFGSAAFAVIILVFLPFYNAHLVQDVTASLRLYYHLFEFNASIFYLIRWIAFHYVDYDIIEEVAPVLGMISFVWILLISWWPSKKFSLYDKSIWIFAVYFLLTTMVHPWYSSILIMLCVFSRYKFPLVFSLLILLSYFPYSLKDYNENLWVILIEYLLLFLFMIWESRTIHAKIDGSYRLFSVTAEKTVPPGKYGAVI